MGQNLYYGLCSGELKHISKVENGLACNCVCPSCKHPLEAVNNYTNKKVFYFRHYRGKECEGAIESALHLLAKDILLKTKSLKTPKYHFDYNQYNEDSFFESSRALLFDNVILEKSVEVNGERIIPDAICEINGKQIFIEFAKTHFIDMDKKAKLKELGVACIEINLVGQILDEDILTNFLNSDTTSKYWVVNRRLDKEFEEEQNKKINEQKIIEKQREDKIEKKKMLNDEKAKQYRSCLQYKILQYDDWGHVAKCPLKKVALIALKTSHFYRHPIFKRIVDGEDWDGKICGYPPHGKHIFIGNKKEKVILFPPDHKLNKQSENDNEMSKSLFAGLKRINTITSNPDFGNCEKCKYYVDYFYADNQGYNVCGYPISQDS